MFRLLADEEFKEFKLDKPRKFRYAVSNRGRLVSFTDNTRDGRILKGSNVVGYRSINFKNFDSDSPRKNTYYLIHKVVAAEFIPRPSEDHIYVLHRDHDRMNNDVNNLFWATEEERQAHYNKSPFVLQARKNLIQHNLKADGHKLSVTQVIHLKKLINDPNRKTRLKILAKRFKISEMQLYRIKSGENWGHIVV